MLHNIWEITWEITLKLTAVNELMALKLRTCLDLI